MIAGSAGSAGGIALEVALALADFDLDVAFAAEATSVGICGPSGSGKSSLLEAIVGWRAVERGRVRLGGRTLLDTSAGIDVPIERRGIGYVPQDALLFPHRDVARNLASGRRPRAPGGPGARRIDPARVVEVLELAPLLGRAVTRLSGGERQRVALARALCSQPEHLVLDEPFGALDRALRRRILPYLIRIREEFGLPTLFVSHDPAEVEALCDEVAVLERGRVVARGAPGAVLRALPPSGAAYTNVLRGTVRSAAGGTARVEIAPGVEVEVPATGLVAGERAVVAVGADDVLVARERVARISARNRLAGIVAALAGTGADVRVDVAVGAGAVVSALLTAGAVRELELAAGVAVELVFKTQSCRVLSR